jgi:hypothetical protein
MVRNIRFQNTLALCPLTNGFPKELHSAFPIVLWLEEMYSNTVKNYLTEIQKEILDIYLLSITRRGFCNG